MTVAKSMGFDPAQVFKTLVARGASGQYYVFDVPVAESLDLKKAARAVGEKSIEMLHQKSCCRSRAMFTAAARRWA